METGDPRGERHSKLHPAPQGRNGQVPQSSEDKHPVARSRCLCGALEEEEGWETAAGQKRHRSNVLGAGLRPRVPGQKASWGPHPETPDYSFTPTGITGNFSG